MAKVFNILLFTIVAIFSTTEASKVPHPDLYGKPCNNDSDSTLAHCDLNKNMYCSNKGVCECIVGERGRIFSHKHKTCIEVGSPENNFACTEDSQCTLSSYGRYSRCNRDYDRCECHDEKEKTTLVENVCYIQSPPQSLGSSRGIRGCESNGDCQGSNLGKLSRCNLNDHSCECYDTYSSGKLNTALYHGRCVYKKMLMEYCKEDDECRAGYHHNAVCTTHEAFLPAERVCQCPSHARCDGNSAGLNKNKVETKSIFMIGLTTIVMGVLSTKVLS